LRSRYNRRGKKGLYIFLLVLVLVGTAGYFIYSSERFERQSPEIDVAKKIYWNYKDPLEVVLRDNSGIKSYQAILVTKKGRVTLDKAELSNPKKEITLELNPPVELELEAGRAKLIIDVQDRSLWNFTGNKAHSESLVIIDRKKPELAVVTNSYAINRGGSALVVFYCKDDNLKDFYIKTNFGKKFYAQPFYKEGYYAALIAWPLQQRRFRADIVAFDKAGNKARAHVPLYLRERKYKTSNITLKKSFLEGKVSDLASDYPETKDMSPIERFRFVNEKLRAMNEKLIHTLSSKVPQERISDFSIKPFYPLKNAAPVASFGTHRFYYYDGKLISDAYHMGLDLASVRHAPIIASNPGRVVFADYNGIYGYMPMLSHGLGLYTLYGHCSAVYVKKGDEVGSGETIAKTGNTGLALGDHLHFGVLVQGIEVRPQEWMDRNWIKTRIMDVLKEARQMIDDR